MYLKKSEKFVEVNEDRKVERYIAKAKDGSYIWDSKAKNKPLLDLVTAYNSGLSTNSMFNINSCGGDFGCHNSDYTFWDSWNQENYDGATDMHLQVTYATDGSGQVGNVNYTANPYGPTPDQFTSQTTYQQVSGDNIYIRFTTTQTNSITVGGTTWSNTTITDWKIMLATCSHTNDTDYKTYR